MPPRFAARIQRLFARCGWRGPADRPSDARPRRWRGRDAVPVRVVAHLLILVLVLAVGRAGAAAAQDRAAGARLGADAVAAQVDELTMEIFSYRPEACAAPSVLVVFHGNGRGADNYRDSAREVADKSCFVIYAPLFDEERFPNWAYHRGGVVEDHEIRDPGEWTIEVVGDLVDWIRIREGAEVPVYLFGHSAGGQFLSRFAAYSRSTGVARIVIANPSTYVLPTTEEAAPYGFGDLPAALDATELMRSYLAAPVTVYLGDEDTGSDDLTSNEQADRQGGNRLDRGQRTFDFARREAERRGWTFGWQLVVAKGVGHTARGMLTDRAILQALGFGAVALE